MKEKTASYQVLARKYRPQRFSDVVGQDHVTQTLANAIRQNRIAHAYLFVGPRGTGKTTLARILAKCLNCTGGPKSDFAEDDPRCQEITDGRSMDVLEIDGASNRGIEEIRALRETVKYAPAVSRHKIYIIDEVHALTKDAFNALLKTLEEPPPHVKFMFATTEPEKVLPTILSRCQRFDLRRIPTALIAKELGRISKIEGIETEEAALHAIARGADGGMRDAESALDQLIAFCGERITEPDVLSMFGLAGRGQIAELARSLISGDGASALRHLDELCAAGKEVTRLISDLLLHCRNLLLYQVCGGETGLLDISEAELATLKEQSTQIEVKALTRMMEVLTDSERTVREAASKRIMAEVALLRTIDARQAIDIDQLIAKIGGMDEPASSSRMPAASRELRETAVAPSPRPTQAPSAKQTAQPATEEIPLRAPAAAAVGGSGDLETVWAQILDRIGKASPFTKSYFTQARPVSLEKKLLIIGFDPEFADQVGLVDNSKNKTLIQTECRELGLGEIMVKFVVTEGLPTPAPAPAPPGGKPAAEPKAPPAATLSVAPSGAPAEPPVAKRSLHEDFKNDPLIKQALEIFKGTIVDVRTN